MLASATPKSSSFASTPSPMEMQSANLWLEGLQEGEHRIPEGIRNAIHAMFRDSEEVNLPQKPGFKAKKLFLNYLVLERLEH